MWLHPHEANSANTYLEMIIVRGASPSFHLPQIRPSDFMTRDTLQPPASPTRVSGKSTHIPYTPHFPIKTSTNIPFI